MNPEKGGERENPLPVFTQQVIKNDSAPSN
jgi:hypothetical protein